MPTILKWRGYRFFFYSDEGTEPPHIHIAKNGCAAKFWLKDGTLAYNDDFKPNEISQLKKVVVKNKAVFLEEWNEYKKRKY